MSSLEPTLRDVLTAVERMEQRFEQRFGNVDKRFDRVETSIQELNQRHTDLHEAVSIFATDVDRRFNEVDKRFEQIDQRFEQVDRRFEQVDRRFEQIDKRFDASDKRIGGIETRMVTKEYLDDRLFALRADLIQIAKRSNKRFELLVEELVAEKVLKRSIADRILASE